MSSSPSVQVHRGDCFDVLPTLTSDSIDIVITDPPYGVDSDLNMLGQLATGSTQRGMYAYGGTHSRGFFDCDLPAYSKWCTSWASLLPPLLPPGAFILAFAATRTVSAMATGFADAGLDVRDIIAWVHTGTPNRGAKLAPGVSSTLSQKWEPIIVARIPFTPPSATATNIYRTHGTAGIRNHPNLISSSKASAKERPSLPDGTRHPSVKPLSLMSELIDMFCLRPSTILDPFAGSGSTGQAALSLGHSAILIEKHPPYADLIDVRLREFASTSTDNIQTC